MLEFLNEQEDSELQNENKTPQAALPEEEARPDLKKGTDEFITTASNAKSVKRSTIILGILFVAGLVGLFIMVKKGAPRIASGQMLDPQQAQIDALVAKLGGVRTEMSNRMDTIVKKFYEFADVKQVSMSNLSKNPFIQAGVNLAVAGDTAKPVITTFKPSDFHLFSIVRADTDPSKWCCMINDKLLNVGQTVLGFTITEIGVDYVVLQNGDSKITLKLEE